MVVRLDVTDGVAHLVLDRPDRANAIDIEVAERLLEISHELHRRDDVRVVLLTGAGKRFCAGGDLQDFVGRGDGLGDHLEVLTTSLHAAIVRLQSLDAPLVVGAHGVAAGAGFSLACAADLLVAGDRTLFLMAYAGVGLTPDGSGSWFLPRLVGLGRALDLALTNRRLSAAEAEQWGIVSRVVPEDEVADRSVALARELARGPTASLGAARRLLYASLGRGLAEQLAHETSELGAAARRPDGREGIAAFVEQRPVDFTGR